MRRKLFDKAISLVAAVIFHLAALLNTVFRYGKHASQRYSALILSALYFMNIVSFGQIYASNSDHFHMAVLDAEHAAANNLEFYFHNESDRYLATLHPSGKSKFFSSGGPELVEGKVYFPVHLSAMHVDGEGNFINPEPETGILFTFFLNRVSGASIGTKRRLPAETPKRPSDSTPIAFENWRSQTSNEPFITKVEEWRKYKLGLSNLRSSDPFWRMMYFSVVTSTTLGYGDIVPVTDFARGLVSAQCILSVFIIGFFLNAVARRKS